MVDHLVGLAHVPSGLPVAIRCGLSAGEPIESDGDLFGLAVGRAARICALAGSGEVLVGEEVLPLVGSDHLRFVRPVDVALKGLAGTHRLLRAERVPSV